MEKKFSVDGQEPVTLAEICESNDGFQFQSELDALNTGTSIYIGITEVRRVA